MRNLIILLLTYITFTQSVFATLNDVDKGDIFNKNLLSNGGFEKNKYGWTASAGTFAITKSSPMVGRAHATWDAAASADTLISSATIPTGMYGRNGVASCLIKTASGTATHTIEAYDGTNVLSSVAVTSSTTPTRASANFIFPSSGSIFLRIYANADEPDVAIDDCYLGPAEGYNVGSVSQATFIGEAYFATTTSCRWLETGGTTLSDFATDTDCPGITVVSNPGPGTISTTDVDLPQITISNLPPGVYEVTALAYLSPTANVATSAAISDGTTTAGVLGFTTNTNQYSGTTLVGIFTYTAAGSRTFKIQAAATSGNVNLDNSVSNAKTRFIIKRFPSSSEQAYRPDLQAMSWSGYHDSTCSWARTSTSFGDPTADATCALVERTNQNFGTVSTYTVTNAMPGIVFTPKKAGRYYVCATVKITAGTGFSREAKLWDGTTDIAYATQTDSTNGYINTLPLCGIVVATSTSSKTLRVQTKVASGSITIADANNAIEWSIFSIDQSLPAPVLVGERVLVSAETSAGQSIAATTTASVVYGTENYDSTGSYDNSTGVFTAPSDGVYRVVCSTRFASGAWSGGNFITASVYKNGSVFRIFSRRIEGTGTYVQSSTSITADVSLTSGETLNCRIYNPEGSARTLSTDATINYINISRMGAP